MRLRSFRLVPVLAALMLLLIPALAAAQDVSDSDIAINTLLVFFAAVLVLFMQAGFAMLEVGLSRMKNAGAVMGKILINVAISFLMFWAIGFSFAFGTGNDFIGSSGWFMNNNDPATDFASLAYSATNFEVTFFFQVVFCAVSLAIVFGAMLDRTKFIGYILFAIVFTGFIYPTVAHWTWGGGWLLQDGFQDFAGSSIVHLQGALAATAGALVLGPRIGKFRNGKSVPIPGHSMPLMILGVIILWVGWMGFNPGSFLNAVGYNFADVAVNTNLAAAAGIIGATVASVLMFKTLDVSQMGNGALAGLVAITAPCAFVDPWAAVVIGLIAGLIVPPLVLGIEKLKIDDPVGALPVHGVAGIWGTLACGLFATADRATALAVGEGGLLTEGNASQLWVQFYGVAATVGFTFTLSLLAFLAIKYTVGLRVSEEDELRGLDISEHGMFGYPERFIDVVGAESEDLPSHAAPAPAGAASTASNPATAS
ncbi:ammonium transporter [Miltoncostaea oceani]|jgi:ammonium transporter, Amt family|uniref:ammonium transporter n=1 Tax=Miltoncostaea oceani TaxID=2843216 RepID=UPI001C3E1B34|nr:ammonium transporter [Miltoncostaea oceani]